MTLLGRENAVSLRDSGPCILPMNPPSGFMPFIPARGMSNSHIQTVMGTVVAGRPTLTGTIQRKLRLPDDDFLVLHDDRPTVWERGDHVVLLLHGLTGSHHSGYMVRTSAKLHTRGVRTFRMDHRGCGAGAHLARSPYHAGRTGDLDAAIRMIERLCPGSPVSVVGYSISGNMLLRYLGEHSQSVPLCLFRAVSVCPPVDLNHSVRALYRTRFGRRYDWYFTRSLLGQLAGSPLWRDDLPLAKLKRLPRRLLDFDNFFTAPASGFESAEHYYAEASARSCLSDIRVHTTILAAEDDPLVCSAPLADVELPVNVRLCLTKHGGHLGFVGRKGVDPDRRWMDWRVIEWLLE